MPRAREAMRRIRAWLASGDGERPAGLVLTKPATVAWVTGGVAPPVDRTAGTDLVWAVLTADHAALITTTVEAERVWSEYNPQAHGFDDLAVVPWHEPSAFADAATELAGLSADLLAADGHGAFPADADDDLIRLRLALSAAEIADLADLGRDAALALQQALAQWHPGERDLDAQARVAANLEAAGADAPVLIVGADDRLSRFRHPMAVGAPARHMIMAVVVARRHGLHAAATRFAHAGPIEPSLAALRDRVLAIEAAVLAASRPGASYGMALSALDQAYAQAGAPGAWREHYQGGPIGFAQREFEIAPAQRSSPWFAEPIAPGHAVAWNPSLAGGGKAEDTYLVCPDASLRRLTTAPGWPEEPADGALPARPGVLEAA